MKILPGNAIYGLFAQKCDDQAVRQTHDVPAAGLEALVDAIGLEPMTFRTSSGCSSQLS